MEERLAAPALSREGLIKHWLLNLAIECPISLRVLFPFTWPTRNVREIPNVQAEDFARNLLALFDSGMIAVSSELPEDDTLTRSGVSLILDRFLAPSQDSQPLRHPEPGRHL